MSARRRYDFQVTENDADIIEAIENARMEGKTISAFVRMALRFYIEYHDELENYHQEHDWLSELENRVARLEQTRQAHNPGAQIMDVKENDEAPLSPQQQAARERLLGIDFGKLTE